jgi:tetratricopeptide (TPR) repeat protein
MNRIKWPMAARILTLAAIALALIGCHKQSVEDFISAGDSAAKAQKFDEAEGDYKQAVDVAPSDARPHFALGKLYLLEHKPPLAQSEFQRVIDLDPKNADAHKVLGDLFDDQGQFAQAEAQYRAAIAINPSDAMYHTELGMVLAKEGRAADAQTELRTAIGFNPKDATAHYQLGKLLAATPGHEAEAKAEFELAHNLDPQMVPPQPAAPPTVTAAPAPAGAPASASNVKALKTPRLFLLTHDSPVFTNPDPTSAAVGNVRHKKYVRVIGIAGKEWLQIKLKDGTVGFIPTSAAE